MAIINVLSFSNHYTVLHDRSLSNSRSIWHNDDAVISGQYIMET